MTRATAKRGRLALLAAGVGLCCLAAAPPVAGAAASDAPSVIEFTVPNDAAIDRLQRLGYDLAEYRRPNGDGSLTIAAVVTPEERAQFEAMGYEAGDVVETPQAAAAARAEADAAVRELARAKRNLHHPARARRGAAATDTVLTSRADYFTNYAGRFISIEARTSDGSGDRDENPIMTAAWDAGEGTPLGGEGQEGVLDPYIDRDPPDANYYMYHRNIFRVGDLDDGKPMPSRVRVASANGGSDTIAVRRWTSPDGKGFPAGYLQDFNTSYVDPQQAYAKIRDLAAEFPNITQIYDLPNKTNGYQRKAQAIVGLKTPYQGEGSLDDVDDNPDETEEIRSAQAVVLTSTAWGHEGGNDLSVQLKDPGAANAPLAVDVVGNAITVNLATDAAGAVTSTASQVVAAINASTDASALVTATLYRGNDGAGVVVPGAAATQLDDFLDAPDSYPRGPQTVQMIRIGKDRDGSKVGVLLYCQEHAREWATSLVCLETAERLLRNYATDEDTKQLVDNLDIFIIPIINADGTAYSRYDSTFQRKNMTNYCAGTEDGDPGRRTSWGVDINRNFPFGSARDGFVGASTTNCRSGTFAGPSNLSEPEAANEEWVQSTFPNIKFANNIHSYGGYFMWPPGAYKTVGRETLPYASFGVNQFFDETAERTLDRIKSYRQTTVLPSRTGPVTDVLYSAAGNSADNAYYGHGIIGYDFEIGVDIVDGTNEDGTPDFDGVGFVPPYDSEGHDEGMEFASGNIGMLEAALAYSRDSTPPVVTPKIVDNPAGGLDLTFEQSEPADIYYTTDGSTPTTESTQYEPDGPRQRVQAVHLPGPVTLKWISYDIKGQTAGVQTYVWSTSGTVDVSGSVGSDVPPTLALTLGPPASFGTFVPGVANTYDASTTASVTSTAADATLSVSDPGHLMNGTYALPEPLQVGFSKSSWDEPVSNDPVTITFSQHVNANDGLRTGTYSKTLTFTLSTTAP